MSSQQTPRPMRSVLHPHHAQISETIRQWFHTPFDEMGYRAETRQWGTYWSNGQVYLSNLECNEIAPFLTDLCDYFPCDQQPIFVFIDGQEMESQVGPALAAAGGTRSNVQVFLAHTGAFPGSKPVTGLSVESVDSENLADFAQTRLKAFANSEESPGQDRIESQMELHGHELAGSGCGLLARVGGEAAGVLWCYEEAQDVWINLVGVRLPFRRQGIAHALLKACAASAYSRGYRSVVLNVVADNQNALQLYHKLGFRDEVYWRCRYDIKIPCLEYA